eukprot:236257_1
MSTLPRLVLTQIELENFKSYYGRRVIGPFHKRFSSIVGPNGSGKSNVIDALLFVFGRRAKQIRLKKISELVHNSENHPNCKQARVNVHFQEIIDNESDDNDFTVVENSQIIISRIATKSNKSSYLINNKASSMTKVKELLLQKGIDLNNNRFLILQGEVESIAMMKPKSVNQNDDGLLEYLEDIIGSNQYVEQINEYCEKVETLSNEVQERLNRVKVVERDRDKLSHAKDEAVQFIKSQLQLWKLNGISKQLLLNKYNHKLHTLDASKQELDQIISVKTEKQKEIQDEMQQIEDQYQEIRKEKNKIEQEVKTTETQFQEFDQLDVSLSERLKYLKKESNRIKRNIARQEKDQEELNQTIDKNKCMIPKLEKEREEIQNDLEQNTKLQENMMNELTQKTQPIKEAMEEKQKSLIPLKDKENQIKHELDIIDNNIESINASVDDAKQRKQDIVQRIQNITQNIDNNTNSIQSNEQQMKQQTQTQNKMKTKHKSLCDKQGQLEHDIQVIRKEYNEMRYKFENENQSNGQRERKLIHLLLEAQDKGDLTGILGRLGDLGDIDKKYDIAASTAATAALNFIVVEKTHHAQRAVEYLKRNNLGRATMLILEKQKGLQSKANSHISTPPNVHRLYDLIRFNEPRFDVAFYFAFRDTLVAKDLNEANQLAFGNNNKRWRVVTMNGQLIEKSGAMTGGGNKVHKGLMSNDRSANHNRSSRNHITQQQLNACEERVNTAQNKLSAICKEIAQCNQTLKTAKQCVDKLTVNERKLNLEINGLKQRKETLKAQLPEIEAMTEMNHDDETRLQQLAEQKQSTNERFLAAQNNCELLEDEIRDLEEEILDAGGNQLRLQKAKLDALNKKLAQKSKLNTKLKVEIKTCHKKLKTSVKKLETMRTNIGEYKKEYEEIKQKKSELEEKAVELIAVLDEKKELLNQKDVEYKKLSKVVEKSNAAITKLTKQIFEEKEKRNNIESEWTQTKNRRSKTDTEWSCLQNKYKKHKYDFLNDDEDEDEEEAEPMDVDNNELSQYLSQNTLKFVMLNEDELNDVDLSAIDSEIEEIQSVLSASAVNMGAIDAYRVKDSEYVNRLQDLQSYKQNRDNIRKKYEDYKKARFDSFMNGFSQITKKLKEMYRMLTCGGDAELELVDSIDPFSEGVQFSVRPPKKSWKNISNLSGGEKTLSSMALVFALHHYKPTPLYVMDEIDAALDFKNVSIVANYIHQRTKNAQFVIISLRNNMFEIANRLVGIYKTNNASKSITIDPNLFKLPTSNNVNNNNSVQTD